jgi:hypothetical protein
MPLSLAGLKSRHLLRYRAPCPAARPVVLPRRPTTLDLPPPWGPIRSGQPSTGFALLCSWASRPPGPAPSSPTRDDVRVTITATCVYAVQSRRFQDGVHAWPPFVRRFQEGALAVTCTLANDVNSKSLCVALVSRRSARWSPFALPFQELTNAPLPFQFRFKRTRLDFPFALVNNLD